MFHTNAVQSTLMINKTFCKKQRGHAATKDGNQSRTVIIKIQMH